MSEEHQYKLILILKADLEDALKKVPNNNVYMITPNFDILKRA